jgi:hypothetical protein
MDLPMGEVDGLPAQRHQLDGTQAMPAMVLVAYRTLVGMAEGRAARRRRLHLSLAALLAYNLTQACIVPGKKKQKGGCCDVSIRRNACRFAAGTVVAPCGCRCRERENVDDVGVDVAGACGGGDEQRIAHH